MDVFGSSGVRGVVNEGLTPTLVLRIAQAAGTVWNRKRVAIARDTRLSGGMFTDAAASGLRSVGSDVGHLGCVPTPAAQFYAERESIPAVLITASHNPPQFNGVKLVGADGVGLPVEALERVERTLVEESFDRVSWEHVGSARSISSLGQDYVSAVASAVDREGIADAAPTVVVDPGHGAGCETSPLLFRRLGCDVRTVNATPDGRFPARQSEPKGDALADCARLVEAADADLGILHDGDADRAVFVDETGTPIDASASLAALAAAELEAGDTMVSAVNVSQCVVDAVSDAGADLELTPIGATHLSSRIRELQADGRTVPIAGEGNGGIFFPPYRTARDGAYTAARFLELVVDSSASAVIEPYDGYQFLQDNLEYEDESHRESMLEAAAEWARAQDGTLDTKDGYRVDFGDAWALVRESGTEPLVRAYAESRTRDRAESLLDSMTSALRNW
jgi:phosphomannomutase/phosphoglucomutase